MKKYSQRLLEATDNLDDVTLDIQITLCAHQVEEMKKFLFALDAAGSMGTSRTFVCFVDGDGGFRPKVTIDGESASGFDPETPVDFDKDSIEFAFE